MSVTLLSYQTESVIRIGFVLTSHSCFYLFTYRTFINSAGNRLSNSIGLVSVCLIVHGVIGYTLEPHCRSAQVWHALLKDFTVLPAHPHVYPLMEWTLPAFAFPADAGPHLPTPVGWKAKLAWAPPWWVNSLSKTANTVVSCSTRWVTGAWKRRTRDFLGHKSWR